MKRRLSRNKSNLRVAMKWEARADLMPGGLADDRKPGDFDSDALAKGTKVEMEHTDDEDIALEIAMDHLSERGDYYDMLAEAEGGEHHAGFEKTFRQKKRRNFSTPKNYPLIGTSGSLRSQRDYGEVSSRLASPNRVASKFVNASLSANRQRVLEHDMQLAGAFRDQVISQIADRITEMDPAGDDYIRAYNDGDHALTVQIPMRSGEHPQMRFHVVIPTDVFCRFAFGVSQISITEEFSNDRIDPPSLKGLNKQTDVATAVIRAVKEYVLGGGSSSVGYSKLPSPEPMPR